MGAIIEPHTFPLVAIALATAAVAMLFINAKPVERHRASLLYKLGL